MTQAIKHAQRSRHRVHRLVFHHTMAGGVGGGRYWTGTSDPCDVNTAPKSSQESRFKRQPLVRTHAVHRSHFQ